MYTKLGKYQGCPGHRIYIHQSCSEVPGHNKQHSKYCFHPLKFRQTTYPGAELLFVVQLPALSKIYFSFFFLCITWFCRYYRSKMWCSRLQNEPGFWGRKQMVNLAPYSSINSKKSNAWIRQIFMYQMKQCGLKHLPITWAYWFQYTEVLRI